MVADDAISAFPLSTSPTSQQMGLSPDATSAPGSGVEDEGGQEEETNNSQRTKRGILEVPPGLLKSEANKHKTDNVRSPPRRKPKNTATATNLNTSKKLLIVIDGPNVAMKHGKKSYFSVEGLKIAIQYYISRGYDAVAFVPEYIATRKAQPNTTLGGSTLKLGDFMTVGDDLPQLMELVQKGLVVLTPPQDYDDSYCIEYAKKHNACIVTNDRYNDHIDKQPSEREKATTRKFIRDHSISFTFIRDEFMPNPDFVFPPH